jgi:hypothetical protein
MSTIETHAGEVLRPMILGNRVELDADAQRVVAVWACLKPITGRYAHSPPAAVNPEWLTYFYENRYPPEGWHIWTVGYEGTLAPPGEIPALYEGHEASLLYPPDGEKTAWTDEAILMTLVVNHVGFKVIGAHGRGPEDPSADLFVRVWPTSPVIRLWPARLRVVDEVLPEFLNMWVAGTH